MPTAKHRRLLTALSLGAAALLLPVIDSLAQAQAPAPAPAAPAAGAPAAAGRGGRGGGPAKTWWTEKLAVSYKAPMRPLWKLSDLKAMHKSERTWSTPIIKDFYQDVTYNSAAPGTKFNPRIHPNTPMSIVVTGGMINFQIEGQQPFTAKRGSIVLVPAHTVYSYDVPGTEDALFVVTHNLDYQTMYPSSEPAPKAVGGGKTAFQIGFIVFIPFLIIDMVVASVLMSMGMMMMSPVIVSLPFKIMLFVLVDGWNLLVGSLVQSFG